MTLEQRLDDILTKDVKNFLMPLRSGTRKFLVLDYQKLAYTLRCTRQEVKEAKLNLMLEGKHMRKTWDDTWEKDPYVRVPDVVNFLITQDPRDFLATTQYNSYIWNYHRIGVNTRALKKTIEAAMATLPGWNLDPTSDTFNLVMSRDRGKEVVQKLPEEWRKPGILLSILQHEGYDLSYEQAHKLLGIKYEE